jgi:hypothetical protein
MMKKRESSNNKNTFIVKVEYCQHGTWQGQLIWAEENKSVRFRSALELVKLMEEVVGKSAEVQNKTERAKHNVS